MRATILVSLVLSFSLFLVPSAQAQPNGAFSSYLVGTFEQRLSVGTFLYIINPTPDSLKVLVAFFDPAGTCVLKQEQTLHPNATLEIVVPTLHLKPTFGAVKIISRLAKETGPNPKLGVVGFERHCIWGVGCWEGNLAGISGEVASPELERILADPCAP